MAITFLPKHIDEFLLVKDSEGLSKSCHNKYEFNLNKFRKWLNGEEVTKMKYYEYLGHLQPYADTYQKSTARSIKTCINYLISAGYDFPAPDFKMPKLHKKKLLYLETDEMNKLIQTNLSPKELLIVRLFISTGLRLNELVMLDWKDINFKSGTIAVNFGKGDKFRTVITDKKTLVLLLKYKNRNDIDDLNTPVFLNNDNKRFEKGGMASLLNRVRAKAGVYFSAHALRRTFARQAVINGMGIEFVQQLMGHESLDLTKHYVGDLGIDDLAKNYNQHIPISS